MRALQLINLEAFESNMSSFQEEVFVFPASFAQQRLWFLDQLVPNNSFYNVPTAVRMQGQLDLVALGQTFNEIVRRHEALRTTFAMVEGQVTQIIAPSYELSLTVADLRETPVSDREGVARKIAIAVAQCPFDLTVGPLLRVKLLQLDEADYVLILNLHHIVSDGWSIGVLVRELGVLYTAFTEGKPSLLPDLSIQYADFAHWQREYLQGEVLESHLSYWRQQLKDLPVLNLPSDRPHPTVPSYRGATQLLDLSPNLTGSLEALSDRSGVSLFMTLLAAFQTLLYRYTSQTDIVVGSPIANRNRTELEGLIGFFVNSLVLRTDISGNPTFWELLERVRKLTLAAYAHQDLPFEKLVEELRPTRDSSRNPLFQVVFALQNTPVEVLKLPGLTLSLFPFETGTARFDLEFHVCKYLDTLKCTVVYSTDLFETATITRMLGHFQTILAGIVANPGQRVANLPLLTAEERHQLLVTWNNTGANYARDICFHQLFEAQVEQTPDAVALAFQDQQLTYRVLNQRANQLAHYLQTLSVVPSVLVGLCVNRSPEMILGILGILKAGGAYVPLDPDYPGDRLSFMLADAQVKILVTQRACLNRLSNLSNQPLQIICLDRDWKAISQQSQLNPSSHVTADNLAYAIYTSGSTGKPKGVLVQHRGLSNLAEAQKQTFKLQPESRILQFASLSFDASIFEIIMALANGASLYLAPKESLLPGAGLLQFLRDNAITHATFPPAVLSILPSENLPALHTVISAGEGCSGKIVEQWAACRQFFNAYGVTEATVWTTVARLTPSCSKPPIGRPILNSQVYILDANLQPVPIGVTGEIYIGGDAVAQGYLNRSELTAQRFIHKQGNRLYKTGDLARYRSDGNIEFVGRIDDQVKLRGFRIELGEVETVLRQHPAIQETVVTLREDSPDNKRLVGYVVPTQKQTFNPDDLRSFLRSRLPNHLIPFAFVLLDTLPLNANSKVDRTALPTPEKVNPELEKFFVARTNTEQTLAKIWADVLNLERVGINENFFDLGGDSFLAMRLVERVQQQFEQELPLSNLFLAPTVEQLAKTLSPGASAPSWSPLVPLQPSGSKPPFFCVHPILGVVLPYYELSRYLGSDQPFYGLQPFGMDGKQSPFTRIEEMASHYIEAVRVIQPRGPYYIGGWSFGGLVAFEMAQQLLSSGHQVALLAMLDTLAPISKNKPSFWDSLKFLLTTLARSVSPFLLDYLTLLERAAIATLLPQESRLRILNELTIRPMLRIFYANSQAVHRYVPQFYPSQITLFRTAKPIGKPVEDFMLGWSELTTATVKVHQIPGNHFSMLKHPHVQLLAEQLQRCIQD